LHHPDAAVRTQAARALGSVFFPRGTAAADRTKVLPALTASLKDEAPQVRAAAFRSIVGFGRASARSIPSLATALHREPDNMALAQMALDLQQETARSCPLARAFIPALWHRDKTVRAAALTALNFDQLGVSTVELLRLTVDRDPGVRRAARAALPGHAGRELRRVRIELLGDNDLRLLEVVNQTGEPVTDLKLGVGGNEPGSVILSSAYRTAGLPPGERLRLNLWGGVPPRVRLTYRQADGTVNDRVRVALGPFPRWEDGNRLRIILKRDPKGGRVHDYTYEEAD
jgi:hypothetical protein